MRAERTTTAFPLPRFLFFLASFRLVPPLSLSSTRDDRKPRLKLRLRYEIGLKAKCTALSFCLLLLRFPLAASGDNVARDSGLDNAAIDRSIDRSGPYRTRVHSRRTADKRDGTRTCNDFTSPPLFPFHPCRCKRRRDSVGGYGRCFRWDEK